MAHSLNIVPPAPIVLWDDYFALQYGMPNKEGMAVVKSLIVFIPSDYIYKAVFHHAGDRPVKVLIPN